MGRGVQSGEGITSYKWGDYDTYSALCEIIDNAIQANAENVHIIVADKKVETASGRIVKRISDVIIYDDGDGIAEDIMDICLVHGGSDRLYAKKGMGKFGHGLPAASCTQADRTEVYSWQDSNDSLFTYFDFEELKVQEDPRLPDTKQVKVPKNILFPIKTIIDKGNFSPIDEKDGTIIYWKMADRHDHKTIPAFFRNFEFEIGRIYRYYIKKGIKITLTGFENINGSFVLTKNDDYKWHTVRSNDPMFLMKNSLVGDYKTELANKPTNIVYGSIIEEIVVNEKKYDVRIIFSHLSMETRKSLGPGEPGGTELGPSE